MNHRNHPAVTMALALGLVGGVAFTGYVLKAPSAAAPSAVATIDYDAITRAVRAGFPAAPAVAAPAPKAPAATAPAPVRKRKPRPAVRVVSGITYFAVPHCTCMI